VHRVCWAAIHPDDPGNMVTSSHLLVTSSLDNSLKIWDLGACLTGKVPAVGGLHYVVLRTSADRQYLASNQQQRRRQQQQLLLWLLQQEYTWLVTRAGVCRAS